MAVRVVRCHPARLDALVAFVAEHNTAPEHHIGYFGLTAEDIRLALRLFNVPFDRAVRLALNDGRLIGVLGADFDRDLGRAWLYGPLVTGDAWDATADALYAAVTARLPAAVGEHEMFVDSCNRRCQTFAARHDFAVAGEWAIYTLAADRLAGMPAAEAQPWDARYTDQLAALHGQLFPRSNYTLAHILKSDAHDVLLIITDGDALHGYFFGHVEPDTGEATVDLVGVAEGQRRMGLGRRLMLAGLARMRPMPGLRQINLSVSAGNSAAIALYDNLGFVRERDMVALRRQVNPSGDVTP